MSVQRTRRGGFTLIELLIVVAIIAILALIAVPNFLEAQIRAKVSRAKTDMRTIVVALEAYFTDWNGYPLHDDFSTPPPPIDQQYHWFQPLTSPVSYITSMPRDPFQSPFSAGDLRQTPWGGGYYHWDPINNTWPRAQSEFMGDDWGPWSGFVPEMRARGFWYVLWSPGPDGFHQFAGDRAPGSKATAMAAFYDPTNGSVSLGDIIRLGPGASDHVTF